MTLWTFGHGTAGEDALAQLIRGQELDAVFDVRKIPKSRTHPHVWSDRLEQWVPALAKAAYEWHPEFGGFRKGASDSPNVALRNSAFRAYADYMQTAAFLDPFDALMQRTRDERLAIMCSESVWWRCHRRLMSDAAVLLYDADVQHIAHTGKTTPHKLTDGVRRVSERLIQYDVMAP